MDFSLSDEQGVLQETTRRFARDRIAPAAAEYDQSAEFPREILQEEWNEGVGSDPQQMLYTWASVMYYFLTHFDYLHE